MDAVEVTLRVVNALDKCGIHYMLVGSMSSNIHGVPRMTEDADFVVELDQPDAINRLARELGDSFALDPQMLFETVTGNLRYVIQHTSSAFKVELFVLSRDAHHVERWRRRESRTLRGKAVWFQTAEDVIIQKLKWFRIARRPKDHGDVEDVLDTAWDRLDMAYIRRWCSEHQTIELLDEIVRDAGRSEPSK